MKKTFTLSFFAILFASFVTQELSAQITSLRAIKNLYTSTSVVLPSAILSGVVISDSLNLASGKGNAIIQSGGTGIVFRYAAMTPYTIGDSVNIDVTGDNLSIFNGALQIVRTSTNVPPPPVARGVYVTPLVTTLSDLTKNLDSLGYTLVKVLNATASEGIAGGAFGTAPGPTFKGSKTLTDASGSMILFTATGAKFSGVNFRTDAQDWTGYVQNFKGTPEFTIRNLDDYVPLSLVFKGFVAETKGTSTLLTWNTASEVNTYKFILEKSLDGLSFSAYSSVDAKGKASNVYSYTDVANKINTTVYYRLKSLDKDGKYMYSSVVKVKFGTTVKLILSPNPSTTTTKLSYDISATDAVARIVTANGSLVKQVTLPAGSSATDISISSLAKGTYYVAITKNGSTNTLSFVKQ